MNLFYYQCIKIKFNMIDLLINKEVQKNFINLIVISKLR